MFQLPAPFCSFPTCSCWVLVPHDTKTQADIESLNVLYILAECYVMIPYMLSLSHLGHMAWRPPSTGRLTPVMKLAASDARKAMACATSSTSPGRPRAWVCLHLSRNWLKKKINKDGKNVDDFMLKLYVILSTYLGVLFLVQSRSLVDLCDDNTRAEERKAAFRFTLLDGNLYAAVGVAY